jgi:hypothetical protein
MSNNNTTPTTTTNNNNNNNSLSQETYFLESVFQGAKTLKEHNEKYYERVVGNWMLTGDFPGPFAPHDIVPFLSFLRARANTEVARDFLEVLIAKERAWLETYPRPWELLASVRSVGEREGLQFRESLRTAFLQSGVLEEYIARGRKEHTEHDKLTTFAQRASPSSSLVAVDAVTVIAWHYLIYGVVSAICRILATALNS